MRVFKKIVLCRHWLTAFHDKSENNNMTLLMPIDVSQDDKAVVIINTPFPDNARGIFITVVLCWCQQTTEFYL